MSNFLAGLGAGLQAFGGNAMQYLAQEQARRERDEERKLIEEQRKEAQRLARQQYDQQMALKRFELGLEALDPMQQQAATMQEQGAALSRLPRTMSGPFGAVGMGGALAGDALSQMARQSQERIRKGRTVEMADYDGTKRTYLQPYERTAEGRAAMERERMVKGLVGAGFTPQEAEGLADSPDELRKAMLETIRPKASGQPREVVRPDGSVVYVQPPALQPGQTWESGLTQRTPPAPGGAPYNWSVQTDDSTGNMMLVDPRTGQSRPVTMPGGQPMRNIPDAVKKKAAAFGTMRANIGMLKDLVERNGIEVLPTEAKGAMESALAQAQVAWKTYAELGALSGPDMGLVIQAIGDPTSLTAGVRGGSKAILSKLNTAIKALDNEEALFTEMYKVPIPGRAAPAAGGAGGLNPQEQAIYDAAKLEGKSDAEIMAFLQRRRGGAL